jgi:hypothetical protein
MLNIQEKTELSRSGRHLWQAAIACNGFCDERQAERWERNGVRLAAARRLAISGRCPAPMVARFLVKF